MNKYLETGTIFRRSDGVNAPESDVTHAVRKAVADHKRLLQGPHGNMAGKRVVTLGDGTIIVTSVNPYGLVPTLVATVTYPPVTKLPEEEFWCEAGLLTWDPLTPYYPLHVYAGDRLKTLLTTKLTDGYYNSHYWLNTRPDIQYPDFVNDFYVEREYWPSFWTGKARLMMQGLHAIARRPEEVFPTFPVNPYNYGIWTAAPGKYFVVKADNTGVFVTKLILPEDTPSKATEALAKLLSGEQMTETQQAVAEACYLAHLERSGDPVEILSASAMAPCIAEGGAMTYGWKFARNKLEASIVTFREECMPEFEETTCIGQFVTSLFTVTAEYSIAEDLWTCAIDQVYGPERSRPRTGITSIWVPSYGASIWGMVGKVPGWGESIYPACCYAPIGDTIQAQYCWYDTYDVLQIVWYVQHQDYLETRDTRPAGGDDRSCELSWSWSAEWGQFGYRQGGFHIGPTAPAIVDFQDGYYDYTQGAYSVTQSPGGSSIYEWDSPTTSDTRFYDLMGAFCSGGELSTWYNDHSPYKIPPNPDGSVGYVEMWAYQGSTSETLTTHRYSAVPRIWSFVVSPHDAEAVYLAVTDKNEIDHGEQQQVISGLTNYGTGGDSRPVFGGGALVRFYSTGTPTLLREETLTDLYRPTLAPEQYLYGGWYGYVFNAAAYDAVTPLEDSVATNTEAQRAFTSPHGSISLPTDGQWGSFFPESVLEGTFLDQMPIKAMISYSGDGQYYSEEGVPVSLGGYPQYPASLVLNPITSFFIGGA